MPCMFCEREFADTPGRKRTREHVFAEWMAPYLRSPEGPGTQVRWHTTAEGQSNTRSYQAYPVQQAVQGVCQECNSGWLSQIQTAAKPYLLPALTRPRHRLFGESAQEAMSIWAFRAALVLGAKASKAEIPAHHLHSFYAARKPPEKCRIMMIGTVHRRYTYLDHRILKVRPSVDHEPPPSANAFATLITVGHVAFYVLCWTDAKPRDGLGKLFKLFDKALVPVHPCQGLARWPGRVLLDHQGLDRLADALGRWE